MSLRIVSADERLSAANNKTSLAIFGPPGSGKTSLLKTLPAADTICLDLEAGMKSVQDWPGDSIPVRTFADAIDIGCLVGGINPAADPNGFFSEGHYQHLSQTYPDLVRMIAGKRIVFVDSMKELPATLILRPFNFDTLATHVYQFASDELLEQSALSALTIVIAGILPVIILSRALRQARPGAREGTHMGAPHND